MGILLAVVGWKEWRAHRAIAAGPEAIAIVTGQGSCPGWQSCTPAEKPLAVAFRLPDGSPQGASVTVAKDESHPIGSRLPVHYDARNPSHAEYVHHGSQALVAFALGLLFVVGSVLVGAFFRRSPLVA
jgi:Protein of unknown function (DUF3592)